MLYSLSLSCCGLLSGKQYPWNALSANRGSRQGQAGEARPIRENQDRLWQIVDS